MGKITGKGLISKGRYELKFRGTTCKNCGHPLDKSDKYCPNCSQANSTKKLTLKDFFDEFFSNIFNYDSKLLKTLYTMLIKPGTITKDYINGKRVSYTNPFRFLLSLAFIYLLVVGNDNSIPDLDKLEIEKNIDDDFSLSLDIDELMEKDSIESGGQLKKVFDDLDSLKKTDDKVAKNLPSLDSVQQLMEQSSKEKKIKDSLLLANPKAYFSKLDKAKGTLNFIKKMEFFYKQLKKDSIVTFSDAQKKYEIQDNWGNKTAFQGAKSVLRVIRQPGAWLNDTIAKLPFAVFLFLPLFTVFLSMVYIRKNYTYTDHLVFSFHNQSLLFILLLISYLVDVIFGSSTAGIFLLVFAVYLFQAMRNFYNQGFFKTMVKYVFLNTVFTILALIITVLLFTGSIFIY